MHIRFCSLFLPTLKKFTQGLCFRYWNRRQFSFFNFVSFFCWLVKKTTYEKVTCWGLLTFNWERQMSVTNLSQTNTRKWPQLPLNCIMYILYVYQLEYTVKEIKGSWLLYRRDFAWSTKLSKVKKLNKECINNKGLLCVAENLCECAVFRCSAQIHIYIGNFLPSLNNVLLGNQRTKHNRWS